jgi:hypothetical protein
MAIPGPNLVDQLKEPSTLNVLDDVDDIIKQLRSVPDPEPEDETPTVEMNEEDLGKFIVKHGGQLIQDSTALVTRLKKTVGASGDPEEVSALADLVSATSTAIETLNKIYTQNKKIKAAKEIKQAEFESKKELAKLKSESGTDANGLLIANREEIFALLLAGKRKGEIIDVEETTEVSESDLDAITDTKESAELMPA